VDKYKSCFKTHLTNQDLSGNAMKFAEKMFLLQAAMVAVLFSAAAWTQTSPQSADLERVLSRMDDAAKDFHTLQANVTWDEYGKAITSRWPSTLPLRT
jgi:hypothetical protein